MSVPSPWIKNPRPNPAARVRLFTLPHAGGGAAAFRTWPALLPVDLELRPIQLPGREERLMEPPLSDAHHVARVLAPAIEPFLDRPFALFGHSMGALVAFELARELRRRGAPVPLRFFASGHRAPQLPSHSAPIHALDDDAFLDEVDRRYSSVPQAARQSPELLELLLPGLRADMAICDTYTYVEEPALECPITACGGEEDVGVTTAELDLWRAQTQRSFARTMFAGGHFFPEACRDDLLRVLSAELSL